MAFRPLHKSAWAALGLVISAAFIYLSFRRVDPIAVWTEMARVNLWILALSLVAKGFGFLLMSYRTRILLSPLAKLDLWRVGKSIFVAFAGNNILPLRMGELLRVHYLARHAHVPHTAALAVVGTERLIELACAVLIALGIVPALLNPKMRLPIYIVAVGVTVGVVAVLLASRYPQRFVRLLAALTTPLGAPVHRFAHAKATRFVEGLSALASTRLSLIVFGLTVVVWGTMILSLQTWIWAWHLQLPWFAAGVIITFINFGTVLPSSPSFVGPYHYFTILALTTLGVDRTTAVAFAIVGHAVAIIPFTIFSLIALSGDYLRGDLVSWKKLVGERAGKKLAQPAEDHENQDQTSALEHPELVGSEAGKGVS